MTFHQRVTARATTAFATICALLGCGASSSNGASDSAAAITVAIASEADDDGRAGYRARVVVSDGKHETNGEAPSQWTDLVVWDSSADAKALCEHLLTMHQRSRAELGVRTHVARGCATQRLPLTRIDRGTHLLVGRRAISAFEFLTIAPMKPVRDQDVGRWIDYSVFHTREDCDPWRAKLEAAHEKQRRAGDAEAQRWLEERVHDQEEKWTRTCGEAHMEQIRCAELSANQTVERASCDLDLAHAERACETDRRFLDLLRTRAAQGAEPSADSASFACREVAPRGPLP